MAIVSRQSPAPQLLGALRGDVDEQEATRDRNDGLRGLFAGDLVDGET